MSNLNRFFICVKVVLLSAALSGSLPYAYASNFLPEFDNPKLRFGTGQVQNNKPAVSDILPAIPGEKSKWFVAQWHQDSLISGANDQQDTSNKIDPFFGEPRYGFASPDQHSHLWIYWNPKRGHLVYELFERGGWVDNGGGSNLFLSTNTTSPQPTFDHQLTLSMQAKLTDASIAYDSPAARRSGAVLGMVFAGFVIQFPSPLNGARSILFIQIALANSLERSKAPIRCRVADSGSLRLLFGGSLTSLPFDFRPSTGSLKQVTYRLNDYLANIRSQALVCHGNKYGNQVISLAHVDPPQFSIKSFYIGLETEHIDKRPGVKAFGETQGDVSLGFQVSDLKLTD